jgi:hypothetical protein
VLYPIELPTIVAGTQTSKNMKRQDALFRPASQLKSLTYW